MSSNNSKHKFNITPRPWFPDEWLGGERLKPQLWQVRWHSYHDGKPVTLKWNERWKSACACCGQEFHFLSTVGNQYMYPGMPCVYCRRIVHAQCASTLRGNTIHLARRPRYAMCDDCRAARRGATRHTGSRRNGCRK